ncbi:MAG: hypothetical protein GKS03_06240 [Alphaproteobacteria bacterium]|nr:hypothetical protein [Alphaproteobacteria bacterium]
MVYAERRPMAKGPHDLKRFIIPVAGLLILSGCAAPDPDAAFRDLGQLVDSRLPEPVTWRTGGPEDAAVDKRIDEILATTLSETSAVQVALLNNRKLQARYAELGIAQADVVQAGLLQNPVFEIMVRPSTEDGTNIELGLTQNFVDLLMRPALKKIAEAEYDAVRLELAAHLVAFVGDVQATYYDHVGAKAEHAVVVEMAITEQDAADLSTAFHTAGNISDLEHAEHLANAAELRAELYEAETAMKESRIELALLLGVSPSDQWIVPSRLSPLPEATVRLAGLEDRAVRKRFDLSAHRSELQAALEELGFEKGFRLFEEGDLSVSAEREPDGAWLIGPALELPLPIFDQGQARVAGAALAVRGMRDRLLAEEREVRADVNMTSDAMTLARARSDHLRNTLLPLREEIVQLTLAEYNYMLESPFQLLETQQNTNETYRDYVEALTDYWVARAKLRASAGGEPLETDLGDAS